MARWLRRPDLGEVAEALDVIAQSAEQTDQRAREVLTALAPCLVDPGTAERLMTHARSEGLLALGRLLRRKRTWQEDAPLKPDDRVPAAMLSLGRALTLGERKSLARRQDRLMLDRLLRDPHPAVIVNLLRNPRITEDDVVRLAARRPTFSDIQLEIAKNARFSTSPRVRLALVRNPFTPTGVSVPLLPLLFRHELGTIAHASELSNAVRGAAVDLLKRRPPLDDDTRGQC